MHFYVIEDTDENVRGSERLKRSECVSALPLRATRDDGLWLRPECTCAAAERLTVTAYVHLPIFMIFSKWQQINQMCELHSLCDLNFSFKNDNDLGEVYTSKFSNQKVSHVPF